MINDTRVYWRLIWNSFNYLRIYYQKQLGDNAS